MKVGILTFHRAYNYGAVLQCYALQQYLLSQGYNVEVIDYRQPWIDACFKPFSILMFKHNLYHPKLMCRYLISFKRRKDVLNERKKYFTAFRNEHLLISSKPVKKKEDMPDDYDAYIIGSDQLWGLLCLGEKFDDIYLGQFRHKNGSKVIGYAISSDIRSIELLAENKRLDKILKGFSAMSLREKNIADKIYSIIGNTVPVTIDPTLLVEAPLWKPLINNNWMTQIYVAIYQVRSVSKYKKVLYEKARKIASMINKDCKIIDLSDMSYSVTDFVSIIKYAKFVVTTSFHATVFSIIFKTPFYAIKLHDGRDNRYVDLCAALGLGNQCIEINEECMNVDVDYSQVDDKLRILNQQSNLYLNNNLKICL